MSDFDIYLDSSGNLLDTADGDAARSVDHHARRVR